MASSRNKSRNRGKRPTATIDLKAKDVSEKVDASNVLSGKGAKAEPEQAGAAAKSGTSATSTPKGKPTESGSPATGSSAKSSPAAEPSTAKPKTTDASKSPTMAKDGKSKDSASTASKPSETSSNGKTPSKDDPSKTSGSGGGIGGGLTHLLAGGVGGVLALLGVNQFTDQAPGLAPGNSGGTQNAVISEALETRLAALEQKTPAPSKVEIPAELESRIKTLEALNTKLASLSETQSKLDANTTALATQMKTLADPSGGGVGELRQRLDSMEGTISSLAKSAEGADGKSIPQLAALAGRMNDLRTELGAKITAAQDATIGKIEKRLTSVDTALKASADDKSGAAEAMETLKGGNERLSLALETARTESTRIAGLVTSLQGANGETAKAIENLKKTGEEISERLTKLESTTTENISALPSQDDIAAAIAPVTETLSAVQEQVGGVLKREATRADSAKKVLLSLELANLQRALDQGRPIASELASIKKSAPEGMDLSVLDKLAENKVPSQEELVREFSSVATEAIQAETLEEDASAFDKLFANARSLVRVRKTGDVEGDTTEAVIARAEDNLKRNDLSAAVKELGALKDKAAGKVAGWVTKANDRLSVDAALSQIEAGLKSAVSSSATN